MDSSTAPAGLTGPFDPEWFQVHVGNILAIDADPYGLNSGERWDVESRGKPAAEPEASASITSNALSFSHAGTKIRTDTMPNSPNSYEYVAFAVLPAKTVIEMDSHDCQ
jgi:hypothetical protein